MSPRYAFGAETAFLLLQPDRSFVRHNLPDDDGSAPGIRAFARAAFAASGRAFVPPAPRSANAHQVVRPLKEGDSPVRWWIDTEASTDAGSDYASSAASGQAYELSKSGEKL